MKRKVKRLAAALLAFMVFMGCVPVNTVNAQAAAKKVSVKSLKLNKTNYVLKKGEKLKLKATISPKKAKNVKVKWTSSNKRVATVSSKGEVKAKASKGKATITAKAGSKKAVCKITIGAPVTKISASNITVYAGKSKQISVTLKPKKPAVKTLSYSSSNRKVATVSKSGKVTGKKAGTAKITITATDRGKVKKVIKVVVKKAVTTVKLKKITLSKQENSLYAGEEWTPKVTYTPSNASNKMIKWSTSDAKVATVDGKTGTVHAVAPGNCVITAVSAADSKLKASCNITVKARMTLEKTNVEMKPGETFQEKLRFDSDAIGNQSVRWTSTDNNIAAVISPDGLIKALTPGTCTVTAALAEDSSQTVSCTVTVTQEGVTQKEVSGEKELITALSETASDASDIVLTLKTEEEKIHIPAGTYSNVILVVDAPNAHIENEAAFKDILVKAISDSTLVEKSGNKVFMNVETGSITVDSEGQSNVFLLDDSESITVTNNGNLQELLIASAAKVLVKGESVAQKLNCSVMGGGSLTTYIPLDIFSTTKYQLIVGPGGEQTAVKADKEESIPDISGIGTLSVTIDSTGENRTVIAENDGNLTDIPKAAIQGKVVNENMEPAQAKVYLVSYSKEVNGENISVYLNGTRTKETTTDAEGVYEFTDAQVGNYILVVEADGYELLTQNIFVPVSYGDMTYEVDEVILTSGSGQPGGISGVLIDAETGDTITKGLTVILRKGMNNITSNAADTVVSDETGKYTFTNIVPGQYTVQVRDNTDKEEYVAAFYNVSVLSGAVVTKNITVSKVLNSQEVRFVLTWDGQKEGVSRDLDIHLYGPNPFKDEEYGIYFGDNHMNEWGTNMDYVWQTFAGLDVDDKEYEGPETITVKNVNPGQYKVFVQDYTNGGNGSGLAASHPVIKVYVGNTLMDTLKMPAKAGGVWYACNYDGATGRLTLVNDVYNGRPNTTLKAKIGTIFSRMEQFEVTDAAAFAKEQAVLDMIKADYLKQQNETKLQEYYNQAEEILNRIKAALTMETISGEGTSRSFYEFEGYHSFSMYGSTETMPSLTVKFAESAKDATYKQEEIKNMYDSSRYKLTINNPSMGISTKYYLSYSQSTEYWVKEINDPDNTGVKTEINYSMAYVGGMNPGLGRNLKVTLMDGIELEKVTYREDVAAEKWNYGDKADAVLHLKKTATGETREYKINYIPLGFEITGVSDANNVILSVDSYISWQYEDDYETINVFGENKTLGTTWKPVLEEGATAVIEYPAQITDENFDGDARITVTNVNGGHKVYHLYYYQDTSDAELIGIREKDNMYTYYSVSSAYRSQGREYYNINIQGVNSQLGENLEVYTRPGAEAKVEYATGSVSWDNTSDARITVTSGSGVERTYYVIYSKSTEDVNIREIDSSSNTLKRVYLSYSSINIMGMNETLGTDITIRTNEGYTAQYCKTEYGDGEIVVTNVATGEEIRYRVNYSQDDSSLKIRTLTSPPDAAMICKVSPGKTSTTIDNNTIWYYPIELTGQKPSCPQDLEARYPTGSSVSITYAQSSENWIYGSRFAAKAEVTGTDGITGLYLISYVQDDSQAIINNITDEKNVYTRKPFIFSSTRDVKNAVDGNYEEVYPIVVTGNNPELGNEYKLTLPEGSVVESTVHKGDAGWKYADATCYYSYGIGDDFSSYEYPYVDSVIVKAANGASRHYLIAYKQDDSGAAVSNITDAQNAYVHTDIVNYQETLYYKEEKEGVSSEKVYLIKVKGNNAQLGTGYKLGIPQGSVIESTVRKGDAEWNYEDETCSGSYEDENGKYIYDTYTYTDRVVVKAANGTSRIYVIAYVQDDSGAVVSSITDDKNAYVHTDIENNQNTLYYKEEKEGVSSEKVYLIKVNGNNAELGTGYKLGMPQGSVIESTVHKGDAEWNYADDTYSDSYRDENDNYIRCTYTYTDRVVVKAANGATRVYVIAYAQDESGTIVSNITDTQNVYVHTDIDNSPYTLYYKEEKEGVSSEEVYRIRVKGNNAQFGTGYKLDIPEGSVIESTVHKGDAEWNYSYETCTGSYEDENGNYIYDTYTYTDRVVVKATNGATRIYVIAYAQDDRGTVVSNITDAQNAYVYTNIEDEKTTMYYKEEKEGVSSEEVYLIKVAGSNAELGTGYKLGIPEGSVIESTVHKGDAEWNYADDTYSGSYRDENDNYIRCTYTYTDRVVVKAANGASRIYVIAYAQDDRGTVVSNITDAQNAYVHTDIDNSPYTLYYKEEKEGVSSEEVYRIRVKGNNAQFGTGYKLDIPEGSVIESTVHKGDAEWNYEDETCTGSYEDENGNYIYDTYTYTDRVVVKAANGASRIYVIAYAQDESGAVVSNITDAQNAYVHTDIEDAKTTMYYKEEKEGISSEKVYLIKVAGSNAELGTGYKLGIPEGSTIESTVHKNDAEWNYSSEGYSGYYLDENGDYCDCTFAYTDRVVVKAANGASRVYVIAYTQKTDSTV